MDRRLIANRKVNGRMNGLVASYVIISGFVTELRHINKMHQNSHQFYASVVVLVESTYLDLTKLDVLTAILMKIHEFGDMTSY
jgi:hypothetical protein